MCFSRYSSLRRKASRVRSGAILSIFAHARKYLELDSDNIAVAAVLVALVRNGLGDPSQPCLFVVGSEFIVRGSLDAALAWILWSLALCLVCSLACALLAVFLCRDIRRARGTFGKELRHAQR